MANKKSIDIAADRVDRMACPRCGYYMDLSGMEPFSAIVCPTCSAQQVVPMRLGSFLLIREMGKGAMGAVYRAFDQTLGRYVAIKVMQKHLAEDRTFADNFIREARAAAALNHPHVVQIYSCGKERGQLYIVMELVDGGRLDEMIEHGEALDEVFTLEVGVQVAMGLEAANDIGLIHGDIKPANILFDKQQHAKVVDFGLARFHAQQHLLPGEIWGTPYYIAPEKVRSQKEDQRADIYSLGATLFHVLAGHPPFEGETAKEVVLARLKSPAISLLSVRPSLQPETADVIARTLEQEPSRRYPTYKSLLADMEEALRVARQRHGMPTKTQTKTVRKPASMGALLVLVLAGGVFLLGRGREDVKEELPPHIRPITAEVTEQPAEPDEPKPPIRPEIVYAVQPFSDEAQADIEKAVEAWKEGDLSTYEKTMTELFGAMPRVGVERVWVGLLQAVPGFAENREGDMMRALRGIHDAQLRELEDDQPHPGAMPQALAQFMVGRIGEDDVMNVAKEWPDWFGDFAQFLFAADGVRQGDIDTGRAELETYLARPPDEVAWPYHYQVVAKEWLDTITEWHAFKDEKAEEAAQCALRALREYRRSAPLMLHGAIDLEIARKEERIAQEEAAEENEQREARAAKIQEDMEKMESVREELLPLVQSRDFRRAATRARQMALPLQTDEGRDALTLLTDSYERMESLKRFIIRGIDRNPIPQRVASELGGDAMSASLAGIRVSLGGYGTMMRSWEQISERLMATLAEYYIAQLPDDERADMTLSLAVFAYQSRGMRPAQMYADRAMELDSDLREQARALMPELEIK